MEQKNKMCTDRKQSKALGKFLSSDTADAFYESDGVNDGYTLYTGTEWCSPEAVLPAWSLSALLGLIPFRFVLQRFEGKYYLELFRYDEHEDRYVVMEKEGNHPIDVCVKMLVELNKLGFL